ncbi:CGI-121-domain-containing protein [Cylindrobasidium torrendii FP15055 ss-10]|uniref:EKC/KEOPS complex subunit CGI121 n=1 Tax=Cylindrobasidium torrendii FP15055 ss-10 TaxID=1314674 RepID=A0A0D7BG26_9AGAR|nr:CGI-121-domain-containing protein [Cylindrobasidium torrendii FP15055 ss-10]
MDSFTFDHLDAIAYYALYAPINNAASIRQRIVAAATADGPEGDREREEMNFAFIDASLITSLLHLQTGIHQAILTDSQGALRTKTVHSEILWSLNPTNNITEAIRRYGISDSTKSLLVVHIAPKSQSAEDLKAKLQRIVDGTLVPASTLAGITDWAKVKKYYKLNNDPALTATKTDEEEQHAVIDNIVTSSVAMKSVTG